MATTTQEQTQSRIHPAATTGAVHYTTANLAAQVAFYRAILGFQVLWQNDSQAALGTTQRELLRLTEVKGAARARRSTGLYHTAFLVPTRWELANLVRQISAARTPVQGTADHGTHLAIYLPDAEGNGIELAWDRPQPEWPMRDGKFYIEGMMRGPVDIDSLLTELERDPSPWIGLTAETRVGHVHLHVSDLNAARRFYHDLLGFDITIDDANFRAIFVSAGGYHHHIGLNVWNGVGAPPPPPNALGLRHFSIQMPTADELQRLAARLRAHGVVIEEYSDGFLLHDPSQNGILLTT